MSHQFRGDLRGYPGHAAGARVLGVGRLKEPCAVCPGTLRMDVVSRLIWIKEEGQTRPTVTAERMEHRHESRETS